ncbi:hypothetical protein PMI21_01823 [Pseudomonas sp. GM18]|nr:hypothetical protein PMI21_01823 [Pseudomonas sp. GM18]
MSAFGHLTQASDLLSLAKSFAEDAAYAKDTDHHAWAAADRVSRTHDCCAAERSLRQLLQGVRRG